MISRSMQLVVTMVVVIGAVFSDPVLPTMTRKQLLTNRLRTNTMKEDVPDTLVTSNIEFPVKDTIIDRKINFSSTNTLTTITEVPEHIFQSTALASRKEIVSDSIRESTVRGTTLPTTMSIEEITTDPSNIATEPTQFTTASSTEFTTDPPYETSPTTAKKLSSNGGSVIRTLVPSTITSYTTTVISATSSLSPIKSTDANSLSSSKPVQTTTLSTQNGTTGQTTPTEATTDRLQSTSPLERTTTSSSSRLETKLTTEASTEPASSVMTDISTETTKDVTSTSPTESTIAVMSTTTSSLIPSISHTKYPETTTDFIEPETEDFTTTLITLITDTTDRMTTHGNYDTTSFKTTTTSGSPSELTSIPATEVTKLTTTKNLASTSSQSSTIYNPSDTTSNIIESTTLPFSSTTVVSTNPPTEDITINTTYNFKNNDSNSSSSPDPPTSNSTDLPNSTYETKETTVQPITTSDAATTKFSTEITTESTPLTSKPSLSTSPGSIITDTTFSTDKYTTTMKAETEISTRVSLKQTSSHTTESIPAEDYPYVVRDPLTKIPCILSRMIIDIKAMYITQHMTVENAVIRVPKTANSEGTCHDNFSTMNLTWVEKSAKFGVDPHSVDAQFLNTISLLFANGRNMFFLDSVTINLYLDEEHFPFALESRLNDSTGVGLGLFHASVKNGRYVCKLEREIPAQKVMNILISDISLIAFNKDADVSKRKEENCVAEANFNLIAIAVSVSGGFILIGILATIIYRRRKGPEARSEVP